MGKIMHDEILNRKVIDFQNKFKIRLEQNQQFFFQKNTPVLLRAIHDSDQKLLEFAFGHFGANLVKLTQILDMNHPDLISIFDGTFSDDQYFSRQCIDFLSLAQYAQNNDMKNIFPLLGNLFIKESLDRNVVKKIDNNNYSKAYVRLILDPEEREAIRFSKKMQIIDLQAFYKKGEDFWNYQPSDFEKFIRYDSAYLKELKEAEKKMKRYQDLKCESLASEIAKNIEHFKENMEQSYYGFNRITMTSAAIILAKSLGYKYNSSYNLAVGNHNMRFEANIVVDKMIFKNFYFDLNFVFDHNLNYEPKVYPFHEVKDIASEEVIKTIELLEKFPEAGNKPIFDHFGVIVPTICMKEKSFRSETGLVHEYESVEKASKELDKILIKRKYFYPIIVGEKDGKCFFICYWT